MKNMLKSKNVTSCEDHLEKRYGKRGTPRREKFERDAEMFRIGVMLEEARKKAGITQDELAKKCGTNKSYISRIENDASDIRFSTLLKIVHALGLKLVLTN